MSIANLDCELLIRCIERKPRSWEDFVDRFLGLVLHIINHTAAKREIRLSIEDRNSLCVEVFAALSHDGFRLLRQYSERSSLTTYLTVTVRRVIVRTILNEYAEQRIRKTA
ncbi:MAG: hypothetical protein FWE67_04875 [Planctomycetaceae bacterium]|nr:hypothetical protein [Planctomycetaceae bacterium]